MQYAPLVAAFFAGLTLATVIWVNFGRSWHRRRQMRRPFEAFFLNAQGERVRELRVPANSTVSLQLRIKPLISFTGHTLKFGFSGSSDERPLPEAKEDAFVKLGKAIETPESDPARNLVDTKDTYHFRAQLVHVVGSIKTIGFRVQTRVAGTYPVRLQIVSDEAGGLPKKPLTLVVQ